MSDLGAGCSRPTAFGALSREGRWGRLGARGWDAQTLAGLGIGGKAEMPFQPGEASMLTVTLSSMSFCSSPPTAPGMSGRELFPQQTPDKTLQHGQHTCGGRPWSPEGPRGSGPPVGQKQQRQEGGTESEGGRGRCQGPGWEKGTRAGAGPGLRDAGGGLHWRGQGPRSQCAPGVLPVCSRCAPSVFQVCS